MVVVRERGRWREGLRHIDDTLFAVMMVMVEMKLMMTASAAMAVGERARRGVTLLFLLLLHLDATRSSRDSDDSVFAGQVSFVSRGTAGSPTRCLSVFDSAAIAAADSSAAASGVRSREMGRDEGGLPETRLDVVMRRMMRMRVDEMVDVGSIRSLHFHVHVLPIRRPQVLLRVNVHVPM